MAMILDAFMSKCCNLLIHFIEEEVIMLLGVKEKLQKLQQGMRSIQSLLNDAEKRKFDDSSIDIWLSELKDLMYDADDIIDLCRIEGAELLADQNPKSKTTPVCCNFSSSFSCFTSVPQRHGIGNRIKELNYRLARIYENRRQFKLEKSKESETLQITQVDHRQTSSMVDPLVVGREVEVTANELVNLLIAVEVEEKCRLFAVTGMGGIGKTTLAQKIFNHPKIQTFFNLKVWACISETYSEIELLQLIIRGAGGSYGNANSKSELQPLLSASVVSGKSFFLVLDDVWRADVWDRLLRVPLQGSQANIRILVTTRSENVAKDMNVAYIHPMRHLSLESSWDMLHKLLFSERQEEQANGLKELGFKILERCGGLPLAIQAIAGVLARKERSRKVWEQVLRNDAWSIGVLPEELRGALYLSYEYLPSHLKQCFLYFSLFREDFELFRPSLAKFWVAEGFITEQQNSSMEEQAEDYFNELLQRNLLLSLPFYSSRYDLFKMHDVVRSLALFLSEGESSFRDAIMNNPAKPQTLRRLSVLGERGATQILDSVADKKALRTLIAGGSDLLLNDEILRQFSSLRVLDISRTMINILPDSIGKLRHLRYLGLSFTDISSIPESIEHLRYLQFLCIDHCEFLTQLPNGITRLHNLRHLNLLGTPLSFIPKGIGKLRQLNHLDGFVVINEDSSSKLEELNSLTQMRRLGIYNLERAQSAANIHKELPYLSDLLLCFSENSLERNVEEQLTVEKLFDELMPPPSLEKLKIVGFFGRHFPNWMFLSSSELYLPSLTKLEFISIDSCTRLPPLGHLPELKEITFEFVRAVKKIEQEFLGGGVKGVAFPKLEKLRIEAMPLLEEWSFDAQDKQHAVPRLKLLPCLHKLYIDDCPLLKQLPNGLKHSAMKSLYIQGADNLKSLDNLPPEIEKLKIIRNKNLKNVYCPPALKRLEVISCEALSHVEKFDSLQKLRLEFGEKESLPEWLLMLLQQLELQNDSNEDFHLNLTCPIKALQECIEGGSHWDIIKQIQEVNAYGREGFGYLHYIKQPYVYNSSLIDSDADI